MKNPIKRALIALLAGLLACSVVGCTKNYVRPTGFTPDSDYAILTYSDRIDNYGFDGAIWNGKTYKIKDAYTAFASRISDGDNKPKFGGYTYVGDKIFFTAYAKKTESGKKLKTCFIGTATAPTWSDMRFIYEFTAYSYDKDYEERSAEQTTFKDYFVANFCGEMVFVNWKTEEITVKQSDKHFLPVYGTVPDVDYFATYDYVDHSVSSSLKDFVMYDEDLNEYTARLDQDGKLAYEPCVYGSIIFCRYPDGKSYALTDAYDFVKNEKPDEETMNTVFEEYDEECEQKNYDRYRPSVTIGDTTFSTDLLDGNGFLLINERSGETRQITADHLKETSPEFKEIAALYAAFSVSPYRADVNGLIIEMGTESSRSSGKPDVIVPPIFFRYDIAEDKAYYIGYSDLNTYIYSVIRVRTKT